MVQSSLICVIVFFQRGCVAVTELQRYGLLIYHMYYRAHLEYIVLVKVTSIDFFSVVIEFHSSFMTLETEEKEVDVLLVTSCVAFIHLNVC